jgi:hypothetical protein
MYHFSYSTMNLSELIGKTLVSVTQDAGDGFFVFEDTQGNCYGLTHHQDCCESVDLQDMEGNLDDLVGSPILIAEEVSNDEPPLDPRDDDYGLYTWTFYKFATIKGYVDMRFYGTSNGYYSVSVDFCKVTKS